MRTIAVTEHAQVRTIRLERPEAHNAMNTELLGELLDALGDAGADEDVRAVVITGGGGTFSAGADLRESLDQRAAARRMELFGQVFEAVATAPTPTIAAIAGHCVGGGAEVAAACDIRVADATASFRFPGAALGYPAGAAKLVGLVGLGAAKDLVLTSRTIYAEEAARIGLVQHLTADEGAIATARELGEQIVANDPNAVAYLKRLFDRFSGLSDRVAVENDALFGLAESGGDWSALTADHSGVGGWAGGGWVGR
ncbi:enoyl-CoA hydratase/isomerase family protein [Egibacter rhizosphaerae]|uniref:Enoyl-CoA hydratase/isomerase family protein n=1 Tax=Egibacter rhizosphaerae TaxID=1670831 RepID=A0A411YJA7_9ACTN|nr:enoyl-CoA hydratase/isomerase family protein [Egibacter rhizosphaerae]QBI21156.1 enoyl-CoA hydratase/isomerase family protein [Egibacter rhizosphaerae]